MKGKKIEKEGGQIRSPLAWKIYAGSRALRERNRARV